MTKRYVATIQVLIPADTEPEACDYVSETLRSLFIDWTYLEIGGQMLSPTEKFVPEPYFEGGFLR